MGPHATTVITEDDRCSAGFCVGGPNVVCDAEGTCRPGTCVAGQGCVYSDVEDGQSCSVACFSSAACLAGECVPLEDTAITCPKPSQPCVESLECDTSTGQCTVEIYSAVGTACDSDASVCTLEVCEADGVCADSGEVETCLSQQQKNPCWTWSCNQKTGCTQTLFVDGNSCNDNNGCTSNDTCQITDVGQKACLGTPVKVDDGNPCTDDACELGTVTHAPLDGVPCDSEDACSGGFGLCKSGACVGATPCECESDLDCEQPENPCNGNKFCDLSGAAPKCALEPGSPVTCDPSADPCWTSGCSAATGECELATANGAACEDGDSCTLADSCSDGSCQPGAAKPCDDNDTCTVGDSCQDGACVPGTMKTCDDSMACTSDACVDGDCVFTLAAGCVIDGICVPEGALHTPGGCLACVSQTSEGAWSILGAVSCDDGDPCTLDDTCDAGSCNGTPKDCDDNDPCTANACVAGDCAATPAAGVCDDDNACTKDDGCTGGACVGTPFTCDDVNSCTADSCNGDGTCDHVAEAGKCVIEGQCWATGAVNPNNPCEVCNPVEPSVWSMVPDTTACPDGDLCTKNDFCMGGVCQSEVFVCEDDIPCTTDSCNAAGQCDHHIAAASCLISGVCYSEGDAKPGSPCETCQSVKHPADWSDVPDDAPCKGGIGCCQSGTCVPLVKYLSISDINSGSLFIDAAINHAAPATMWAATFEGMVVRSDDAGETWLEQCRVPSWNLAVAFQSQDRLQILVSAVEGVAFVTQSNKLYRVGALDGQLCTDLSPAGNPGPYGNHMRAAVAVAPKTGHLFRWVSTAGAGTLETSADLGDTWAPINHDLPSSGKDGWLSIDPDDDARRLVGRSAGGAGPGLYHTTNGFTWTLVDETLTHRHEAVRYDPAHAGYVYSGSGHVSMDDGASFSVDAAYATRMDWVVRPDGSGARLVLSAGKAIVETAADMTAPVWTPIAGLAFDGGSPFDRIDAAGDNMLVVSGGRLHISTNGGAAYNTTGDESAPIVLLSGLDTVDGQTIYGVDRLWNTWVSADAGHTWTFRSAGPETVKSPDLGFIQINPAKPDNVSIIACQHGMGGAYDDTILVSQDGMESWQLTGAGIPSNYTRFLVFSLTHPTTSYLFSEHTRQVSNDNGVTYTSIPNPPAGLQFPGFWPTVDDWVHPLDPKIVFVSTSITWASKGLYKYDGNTQTLTEMGAATKPLVSGEELMGMDMFSEGDGFVFRMISRTGKLIESLDHGDTWKGIGAGSPSLQSCDRDLKSYANNHDVMATWCLGNSKNGVAYTTDGGDTWTKVGSDKWDQYGCKIAAGVITQDRILFACRSKPGVFIEY